MIKISRDSVRTGGVGDFETTELERRSQDGVRLHGKVKEVNYKSKPPKYRAEFGDPNDEDNYILTDWLPASGGRAKGDRDTHFLEVGERVTMLSEGGEFSTGSLTPAGTYTDKEDDEKAGTDKPGVWKKNFSTGAEISYDRETGDLLFNAKGKKKGENGGQDQEIAGTATINAGGGTLVMKQGSCTITFGGATLKFSADGLELSGGKVKHNGHSIGDDHKHTEVQKGGDKTGSPE